MIILLPGRDLPCDILIETTIPGCLERPCVIISS